MKALAPSLLEPLDTKQDVCSMPWMWNKVYMKEVSAEISLSRLYFWNLLGKAWTALTLRGLQT